MKLDPNVEDNTAVSDRYQGKEFPFDEKVDGIILAHAYSLFDLHAKQRMDGFRSYLVASAVVFAAFAAMWREEAYSACAMVAFVYLVINLGFYTLDLRVLQLIKIAESTLIVIQAKLRASANWSEVDKSKIEFFRESDAENYLIDRAFLKFGRITYRDVFYRIFGVMSVLSFIGLAISLYLAV